MSHVLDKLRNFYLLTQDVFIYHDEVTDQDHYICLTLDGLFVYVLNTESQSYDLVVCFNDAKQILDIVISDDILVFYSQRTKTLRTDITFNLVTPCVRVFHLDLNL